MNGVHFSNVLDVLVDFLREIYIASVNDEDEFRWPNDLRLQPHRDRDRCDYRSVGAYNDINVRKEALSVLQKLNSLNRQSHAVARRVLGYSLVFRLPEWSASPHKSYMDGFNLLGNYTRLLAFRDSECHRSQTDEQASYRDRFLHALQTTPTSLRDLRVSFRRARDIHPTLKNLMECAPNLEELSIICYETYESPDDPVERLLQAGYFSFGWDFPVCVSLRIIRLKYIAIQASFCWDHELPSELSSLCKFKSLEEIHVYDPYRHVEIKGNKFPTSIQKWSWTRDADGDFALESVWINANEKHTHFDAVPEEYSRLIRSAENVTLEVPYIYFSAVVPIVLPIWRSLRSLAIVTDDFPTPEVFRHIPSSLDLLIVKFKAHHCRTPPHFLDRRLSGFIASGAVKDVRLCISFATTAEFAFKHVEFLFRNPDNLLFVESRALCIKRGGRFT